MRRLAAYLVLAAAISIAAAFPFGVRGRAQELAFRFQEFDAFQSQSSVNALAFDPKSERLAVGLQNGSIVVRNVSGKSLVQELKGHTKAVRGLSYSPDGRFLVSAAEDETVRLWDLNGGGSKTFSGHKGKVNTVSFGPDGATFVSGGDDKKVIVWSAATGRQVSTHQSHQKAVLNVFFRTADSVISVGEDRNAVEWQIQAQRAVRTWQDPAAFVHSAAGGPGWEWLLMGTEDMGVEGSRDQSLRNTPAGASPPSNNSGGANRGVGSTAGGARIGMNRHSELRIYGLQTGRLEKTFNLSREEVAAIAVSADFNFVALVHSGATTAELVVYDMKFGHEVATLVPSSRDNVQAVSFSPNGQYVAAGLKKDGRVMVWKTEGIYPRATSGTMITRVKMSFLGEQSPLLAFDAPTNVAVMNLGANNIDAGLAQIVSDQIRARLSGAPNIQLVERQRLDNVIAEQRLQSSGLTDPATASQIGRLLGVSRMVQGTLSRLDKNVLLFVQVVDTTTGGTFIRQVQCNECSDGDLTELVAFLAPALVRSR